MTRDDFFNDLNDMVRLLGQVGLPADLEAEAIEKLATMRTGGRGVSPGDLLRYSDAIDWTRQDDAQVLGALTKVLLRVVVGLASELESFVSATRRP